MTTDDFKKRLEERFPNQFEVLGSFISVRDPILVRHIPCGEEYYIKPLLLYKHPTCRICGKRSHKEKTTIKYDEILERIKNNYGDNVVISGYYEKTNSIIHVKFLNCNHEYDVKVCDFIRGNNCRICRGVGKKTDKEFKTLINEKFPGKYTLHSEYKNAKTKILVEYMDCGCIRETLPYDISVGRGCKIHLTKEKMEMWHDLFLFKLEEKYPNTFKIHSDYTSDKNSVQATHLLCGNSYKTTRSKLLHYGSCPYCNGSLGETRIIEYFNLENIEYRKEYIINECRYINALRFDFMIKNKNGDVCLIEYQGRQHYDPSFKLFGLSDEDAIKNFNALKERDRIKKDFCEGNKIPLLCIHHKDIGKIRKILNKFIFEINDIKEENLDGMGISSISDIA